MIEIWTDGAAQPTNPGPAGAGAIAYDENDEVLFTICDYLGEATNNVAEYEAVIRALRKAAREFPYLEVVVYMDSRLVVEHFDGTWKCRNARLRPLLATLHDLADHFFSCELVWIPRDLNVEADELSKLAITRG